MIKKFTRVQRIEKTNKMNMRKRDQRDKETHKNFATSQNEGGLTFEEVLQEERKKFEKQTHQKQRGYFMIDTMPKEYWEELKAEKNARIAIRGV